MLEPSPKLQSRHYIKLLSPTHLHFLTASWLWYGQNLLQTGFSLKTLGKLFKTHGRNCSMFSSISILYSFGNRSSDFQMDTQNKDYISQPPLHLYLAMWLHFGQWIVSKSNAGVCNFQEVFLKQEGRPFFAPSSFPLTGMWRGWMAEA